MGFLTKANKQVASVKLGSTDSHGNPPSTNALNTELNNVARNTNDTAKARALVEHGADLSSTNGPFFRHTPLHQAAYHGRYEMAKALVDLGAPLHLHSHPCGRGHTGTPLELARGGGHHKIAAMIEAAAKGDTTAPSASKVKSTSKRPAGTWQKYTNVDMCCQGDVEIIGDWKAVHTIDSLKRIVEEKGYSAVCVGSFGHAALKSFDFQLTKEHCKPSQGYTNELHIWFPAGDAAKPTRDIPARLGVPAGFAFHDGYGEAKRADQIEPISSGGIEGHCFGGDRFSAPLQWAAMIGDVAAIEALVAHGHDPNNKMLGWFDSEPLGWAASFGQCRAIEALIAAGADPRRPANLAGNTPLADAQREGHSKAAELLQEYLAGKRPIGPVAVVATGVPMAVGTSDEPSGVLPSKVVAPPLHVMADKLRSELGIPSETPMMTLVDHAVAELCVGVAKSASVIEKAEAAWRALVEPLGEHS